MKSRSLACRAAFPAQQLQERIERMAMRGPRYPMEEFARRGEEIYDRDIRPKVEADNKGKVVAIDIETGEYELAEDELVATNRLYARCPDAQPWLVRVGYPALHQMRSPRHRRPL
jgi:hypothetical protein